MILIDLTVELIKIFSERRETNTKFILIIFFFLRFILLICWIYLKHCKNKNFVFALCVMSNLLKK